MSGAESGHDGVPDAEAFQEAVTDTAIAMGARIQAIHGPVWAARQQLARTVLSLASGALVLSVTFGEKVVQPSVGGPAQWALAASWAVLVLSSIMALVSLWSSVGLASFAANVHSQSDSLQEQFRRSLALGRTPSEAAESMAPHMLLASQGVGDADASSRRWLRAALMGLVLGLLLLGVTGGLQLVRA